MIYFGTKWHKKIVELKISYNECWRVNKLSPYFFEIFNCQEELKSVYNKVLAEINLIKVVIDGIFKEIEREENIKLRNYVKTLLNEIEENFDKLQNNIKEMINNVG